MVLVHGTSSHFHLYTLYTPSFISIPFLLYKIWAGQATIMKTWLRGNNSVNIQGRIMVLVPFLSLLSIYKPSFIPIPFVLSIKDMARTGNNYEKWLWGDNSINILGRSMVHGHCPSPYCLYTKFYLNAISSFKVICRTRYQIDGQTDKAVIICFPLWAA